MQLCSVSEYEYQIQRFFGRMIWYTHNGVMRITHDALTGVSLYALPAHPRAACGHASAGRTHISYIAARRRATVSGSRRRDTRDGWTSLE